MLLPDADRPEPVHSGASELALFLTPELGAEAREVEAAVDRILLALEEFCSLADMIRSDTSQMLEENIPLLKAKVTEVRSIYAQVDRLEAFIKMVGHHTAFLEAHVLRAEQDHGTFPQALWRWLGSAGLPSFRNKPVAPAPQPYELPMLYRTEDYFPMDTQEAKREVPLTATTLQCGAKAQELLALLFLTACIFSVGCGAVGTVYDISRKAFSACLQGTGHSEGCCLQTLSRPVDHPNNGVKVSLVARM